MAGTSSHVTPIRLGVKFEPARIVLVYRERSQLRTRSVPARNLDILSDTRLYAENMKLDAQHRNYFDRISSAKLERMVFILQDHMKGYTLDESLQRAKKRFDTVKKQTEDDDDDDDDHSDDDSDKNSDDAEEKSCYVPNKNVSHLKPLTVQQDAEATLPSQVVASSTTIAPPKAATTAASANKWDINDFNDTDDEDKTTKSVSTIEDVKKAKSAAKIGGGGVGDAGVIETSMSKSTALDLLSTQLKFVKSNMYDFEDDAEEEAEEEMTAPGDNPDNEAPIETERKSDDDSDNSF